jgi:sec-independent protein translocase protein TatA
MVCFYTNGLQVVEEHFPGKPKSRGTKMFGIGMPELIIILAIIMLIFGAGKLPEVGDSLGKAIRGFKNAVENPEKDDNDADVKKIDNIK